MPSSQENNETITTFTLSFGGIEFCLSPSIAVSRSSDYVDDAARSAAVMSIAKIRDGEVSIDLNGFVGTLRVRDRNAVVRADVVVAATTESPIIGRNDDEDDDRRTRSGAGGLPSSLRDDGTSGAAGAAAAAAAAAAPPNPVEDTPSPNEKGRAVGGGEEADEEEEEEEEEKPTKAGGGGVGRRKKGRQQKLDFFGRNGNKRGLVVASKVSVFLFRSDIADGRMHVILFSIVCAIRFSLSHKNFVLRQLKNQATPHPSVAPTQRESSIRRRKLPTEEGRSPARATTRRRRRRRRRMRHLRQTTTLQSSKISSKRSRGTTTRAIAMHWQRSPA
jgi:hypothetical protein